MFLIICGIFLLGIIMTGIIEAVPESLPLPRYGNARRVFIHRTGNFFTLMFSNTKHFLYQDYDWRIRRRF